MTALESIETTLREFEQAKDVAAHEIATVVVLMVSRYGDPDIRDKATDDITDGIKALL